MTYEITRAIGIDMAHRVTHHGSKCKNIHGHRYTIEATCRANTLSLSPGVQQGMVLDFGFLKGAMMDQIDAPCDHGLVLWVKDPLVRAFADRASLLIDVDKAGALQTLPMDVLLAKMDRQRTVECQWDGGKLLIVPTVPTAENLAELWFHSLYEPVRQLSEKKAHLHSLKVWETPNCSAVYCPSEHPTIR